jgi:hypothetical protein
MKNQPDPIQTLRVALHARTLDIQSLGKTRELSLALTTCQQARMLLGDMLRLTGHPTPYAEADNPASAEVAPTADVAPTPYEPGLPGDDIAAVKEVRRRLGEALDTMTALQRKLWARDYGSLAERVFERAYTELALSKNWLGMQLSRLDAEKKPAAAAA